MQKKLIALAVTGALSAAAAHAADNVTVYGIVDAGYGYYSDANNDNSKSISKIDGNQWKTSRFGFKGSEDLGSGLTANFQLEASLVPDTATVGGRNSWVSLKSASLGELKAGSFGTFHDDLLGATSVMFANATVASPGKVYVLTSGDKETGDFRNAAAYYTPNWNGLQFKLGASTQSGGTDEVEVGSAVTADPSAKNSNNRVYAVAAHYANGPLVAGATYEYNKYQDTGTSYDSGNEWHLAASYNFGVARVSGAYGITSYADNGSEIKNDRKQWQLGVSAPIGSKDVIMLNYARAKIDYQTASSDDTVSMWGVGYQHILSKRTSFYAAYGKINQNDSNIIKSRVDGGTFNSTATAGNIGYQSAFNVGVRHDF